MTRWSAGHTAPFNGRHKSAHKTAARIKGKRTPATETLTERLGFVVLRNRNGPAGAHQVGPVFLASEDAVEAVEDKLVFRADGGHLNKLAVKQFDAFVGIQDAGSGQPMVFADREGPYRQRDVGSRIVR